MIPSPDSPGRQRLLDLDWALYTDRNFPAASFTGRTTRKGGAMAESMTAIKPERSR
jgi:hypothetical protein